MRICLNSGRGLSFILSVSLCLLAGKSFAQSNDVTGPAIVSFTFSPTTVDVSNAPAVVTITMRVTDASGVSRTPVVYVQLTGNETATQQTANLTLTSGNAQDGIYTASVTIPRGAAPGLWSVFANQFFDIYNNASGLPFPTGAIRHLTVTNTSSADTQAPTIPTGLTFIVTSATQITMSWTHSLDNVAVTSYKIYRDGALIATLGNVTTYTDAELTPSTVYSYRVSACDATGNCSAQSVAASAITQAAPDRQQPTAPTGVTARVIGSAQINLDWTASTDNVGVTQYKISRTVYNNCVPAAGTACAAWVSATSQIATLSGTPPATTYVDTTVLPATRYDYAISACDAAGNCSAQSALATATTNAQAIPTTRLPPSATASALGAISSRTVSVTVTLPLNVHGLTGSVYVAAVLPASLGGGVFFRSSNGSWSLFVGCETTPVVQQTSFDASISLPVVANTDLSTLVGTTVYVGYGFGEPPAVACADMLQSLTYAPAYTVN